jgi:hypothetical protein
MKFPVTGRPAFLLLAALMILRATGAEETAATAAADDQSLRKISGIFDTDLPKTEKKGRVRFLVHPHLGDFTRRPYIRVPFGVRWGATDDLEFSATVEPYFQHGLKSGASGNGIGDVEFGWKYAFHAWLKPDYDASVGINTRLPVGHPPLDMTDGYDHYAPYLVVSKKSARTKGLTYFVSTTLDVMEKSSVAGSFRRDDAHSTSMIFGTGLVLDRYPYHYTLETGYQTTSLVGRDNQQFFYVRPGFAWDLPRRLTFNSRGRWLLGGNLKITQGPDGTRFDSGGKLRGEFSLTRWFSGDGKNSGANAP